MSDSEDRRLKDRYSASCLKVQVRQRGFFKNSKPSFQATCLDLNRYGMALLCPRPLDPGTRLFMDFEGKYISESKVCARVVECRPFQAGYRISVQFSYYLNKKGYSRAVDNALSRIEGFYNRLAS
ncbi:PilZ domain-containing protein [Marinobacter xiaoshiensis]|uniref:PilZ domain-containing protein n=1 Tax=Marinobacter xiaoshiensis TaxID=3073652 RepID=A0ABU2HKQ8_9GAMM|nr:PilZ domain-containing protein [Marinobacter sp. F60267]MDS1311622.1 PilZ domain-containing protein [Marinobacter sp. F60267]